MNNTELPSTKVAARAAGLSRYFTGKPCKHGHTAPRHLTGTCVECAKLAVRRWEARNPGAVKERMRRYYRARPEKRRETYRAYYRRQAGIPEAPYPAPNNCESCARELLPGKTHLDHDHTTGKFRGWLCNRCNLGLGNLGDTVAGLERALDYLRRTGSS